MSSTILIGTLRFDDADTAVCDDDDDDNNYGDDDDNDDGNRRHYDVGINIVSHLTHLTR